MTFFLQERAGGGRSWEGGRLVGNPLHESLDQYLVESYTESEF
jgi:hypothetical protein